jgi:phage recombination protein Bet
MSLTVQQQNAMVLIEFSEEMLKTIQNMYFKDSSIEEFHAFVYVCQKTGLDPIMRQIHPVKRAGKMTIQTGIDGFRLIAERSGKYSPGKEPTFTYDVQGKLKTATSYIKKQTTDGSWHEVSATAFWDEYVQSYNGKPSQFWAKMPHTMLSKVAEALALRKAFPADLSGLYTEDEMSQAKNNAVASETPTEDDQNIEILATPQQKPVEEVDFTEQEITDYIFNSGFANTKEEIPVFRKYLDSIKTRKEFTYKKCIEMFKKNHEAIESNFSSWLEKNA